MNENAFHTTKSHLISISESEWAFWRWVCVRSAGFPCNEILKLATPNLITSADELIGVMQTADSAWIKAQQDMDLALKNLESTNLWSDKKIRKALLNAKIAIKAKKQPHSLPETVHIESINKLEAAVQQVKLMRARFTDNYSKSVKHTTAVISEIANLPNFREAITWQNRSVLRALDSIIQKSLSCKVRNSNQRRDEELIALYWQRYCTKNDTIGFFGPVGWAQFVPDVEYISIKPGQHIIGSRKLYWEVWAIEELGIAILRKYGIQPWITPFLTPLTRIEGMILHRPGIAPIRLTAGKALLLEACNGRYTAKQIAEQILKSSDVEFRTVDEVYQFLSEMAAKDIIFWQINIPMEANPEHYLRIALQRIEDPDIRQLAIATLDELDLAMHRVEVATGDQEKLNLALNDLEQIFTRITGLPATRNEGMVCAGRTIIYEDCRRDVEVLLGQQILNYLAKPLSLLLVAGRWFSSQLAIVYKNKIMEIYSAHLQLTNNPVMEAGYFFAHLAPFLFKNAQILIAPIQEQFRQKWEFILQLGDDHQPVKYSYEAIHQLVLSEFPSTSPGWIGARYHSPDIMIVANNEEEVQRGECLFLLGELHMCRNSLDAALFVNQHPTPDELINAVEQDLVGIKVLPQEVKMKNMGTRSTRCLIPKSIFQLEFIPNSFISDRAKSLSFSSLVIEKQNDELVARTRDGNYCSPVIELLGVILSHLSVDCFNIMMDRLHTPRISIDNLIIKRESWSFLASDLQYFYCSDPAETFLLIRKWAKNHSIPRFVFFKVPVERKPIYLDFESPILVSIFAKLIRRTLKAALSEPRVDITEMLPGADQLVLRDKQDHRYTCEFRMVAVDIGETSN